MTLRSGVDMIEIERVGRSVERYGDRFLNRIFTPHEQSYCGGRLTSLAGRFAVKEAVAKALGTGVGDMNWVDIEIINDERGAPSLLLHNDAAEIAAALGLTTWSISLSHTDTHAIGFAIAMG